MVRQHDNSGEGEVLSDNAIKFPALVAKVQTLADNGLRVMFDLPETAIPQMAMLAECKRQGILLRVECKADTQDG